MRPALNPPFFSPSVIASSVVEICLELPGDGVIWIDDGVIWIDDGFIWIDDAGVEEEVITLLVRASDVGSVGLIGRVNGRPAPASSTERV